MRRLAVVLSALTVSLGAATAVTTTANAGNDNDPYTVSDGHAQAGPMAGIVPARDSNAGKPGGGGGGGRNVNLQYHLGPVRHGTHVVAIFWGTGWKNYTGDKITGLTREYQNLTGSAYAATNSEYTDTTNVDPSVTFDGSIVDTSPSPSNAPSTGTIAQEVVHALALNNQTPTAGYYYPVYIDHGRGTAGYCAWHSSTNTGTIYQFGFFFNLDGDGGCDVSDSYHSTGLASLGNVTGHEYSEMVTDPQLNAWYDQQGNENADKCAWHFSGQAVQLSNKENWTIQGNWSNAAYTAGTGYYNRGCIDGNQ